MPLSLLTCVLVTFLLPDVHLLFLFGELDYSFKIIFMLLVQLWYFEHIFQIWKDINQGVNTRGRHSVFVEIQISVLY